ncbi:MAG: hypothetical protein HQK54_15075 [Oligoflexales bacterium]|nr:hypothetical protein [Oligoflexales bacterium]
MILRVISKLAIVICLALVVDGYAFGVNPDWGQEDSGSSQKSAKKMKNKTKKKKNAKAKGSKSKKFSKSKNGHKKNHAKADSIKHQAIAKVEPAGSKRIGNSHASSHAVAVKASNPLPKNSFVSRSNMKFTNPVKTVGGNKWGLYALFGAVGLLLAGASAWYANRRFRQT